jgi:hypothetical protein
VNESGVKIVPCKPTPLQWSAWRQLWAKLLADDGRQIMSQTNECPQRDKLRGHMVQRDLHGSDAIRIRSHGASDD